MQRLQRLAPGRSGEAAAAHGVHRKSRGKAAGGVCWGACCQRKMPFILPIRLYRRRARGNRGNPDFPQAAPLFQESGLQFSFTSISSVLTSKFAGISRKIYLSVSPN